MQVLEVSCTLPVSHVTSSAQSCSMMGLLRTTESTQTSVNQTLLIPRQCRGRTRPKIPLSVIDCIFPQPCLEVSLLSQAKVTVPNLLVLSHPNLPQNFNFCLSFPFRVETFEIDLGKQPAVILVYHLRLRALWTSHLERPSQMLRRLSLNLSQLPLWC